jgi:hypothetical protein
VVKEVSKEYPNTKVAWDIEKDSFEAESEWQRGFSRL